MTKLFLAALFAIFFSGVTFAETEDESDSRRLSQYLSEEQQKIDKEAEITRWAIKTVEKVNTQLAEVIKEERRRSDESRKLDDQVFDTNTEQDPPRKPFVYDNKKVKKMIYSM